jgi:hypothetical protein
MRPLQGGQLSITPFNDLRGPLELPYSSEPAKHRWVQTVNDDEQWHCDSLLSEQVTNVEGHETHTLPSTLSRRRFPFRSCRALRPRRSLQQPSPSSATYLGLPDFRPCRPPDDFHEPQSLHLRYGPNFALPTLSSCRYLHEPKARFPVDWLIFLPGREFHPLEAPGFAWRTEKNRSPNPPVPRTRLDTRSSLRRRRILGPIMLGGPND